MEQCKWKKTNWLFCSKEMNSLHSQVFAPRPSICQALGSGMNEKQSLPTEAPHLVESITSTRCILTWFKHKGEFIGRNPWTLVEPMGNRATWEPGVSTGKLGHSLLNPHSFLVVFFFPLSVLGRLAFSLRHVNKHGVSATLDIPFYSSSHRSGWLQLSLPYIFRREYWVVLTLGLVTFKHDF